jgi:hypothetical protein
VAVTHLADEQVVPVSECIGLNGHLVADGSLGRIATAVDLGAYRLDDRSDLAP